MTQEEWEVLDTISGSFHAEILRGILEAQDIPVVLSQEGAGRVYAVTVGPLGDVQIMVPHKDIERAREILESYYHEMKQEQDTFNDIESEGEDEQPS